MTTREMSMNCSTPRGDCSEPCSRPVSPFGLRRSATLFSRRRGLKRLGIGGRMESEMRLLIIHYHLRPGGIRRVIELATPHLVKQLGGKVEVVLATGERADAKWEGGFRRQLGGTPV